MVFYRSYFLIRIYFSIFLLIDSFVYLKIKFVYIFLYSSYFNLRNIWKKKKHQHSRVFARLIGAPQRKGLVIKLTIITPKKPNSALRHVVKMNIYKTSRHAFARLPGIGNLPTKYNRVLARGGRANDLPTVRLSLIRGVYDFAGLFGKKRRRSLYGTIRPEGLVTHVRRRYRHLRG